VRHSSIIHEQGMSNAGADHHTLPGHSGSTAGIICVQSLCAVVLYYPLSSSFTLSLYHILKCLPLLLQPATSSGQQQQQTSSSSTCSSSSSTQPYEQAALQCQCGVETAGERIYMFMVPLAFSLTAAAPYPAFGGKGVALSCRVLSGVHQVRRIHDCAESAGVDLQPGLARIIGLTFFASLFCLTFFALPTIHTACIRHMSLANNFVFGICLLSQEGTKAWVAHPRAARVNGVIHFLGGAFAGAAPQLLYNGFIELLADAGYTTIATPYAGELANPVNILLLLLFLMLCG
jgi:hypothetical protein